MTDVDNILKEAGAGLDDLLRPAAAAPTGKPRDAWLANSSTFISSLRGPEPEAALPRPVAPTQPFSFPKPPAGDHLRSGGLGIAAPIALPPVPTGDGQQPVAEPPLQVTRLERPR